MICRSRALLCAVALVSLVGGCTATPSSAPQVARRIAASDSPSQAGGACRWMPVPSGNGASVKDVGTPPAAVPSGAKATMSLATNLGAVEIAMDAKAAPCAVASFSYLAGKKFFDGTACHRLTTAGLFVLQCGDPSGTSTGGPAYQYAEENLGTSAGYLRGSVAIARTQQPGTSGSQFFINYADNLPLSADYTRLGTVTKGMDIIDKVAAGGVTPGGNGPDDGVPKTRIVLQQVTVVYN
ncbi:peptidylprolyl isomerase [Dactylosporangium sp. NPDC005555]|uniref:peptidylprolyl isomerase n=1 Tax=Dactylosporangium sp. NPDC005555 TaxID=3154889 RepID=UPI0033B04B7E